MSDNVIPFNNEEEQDYCPCPSCDLINEFIPYVIDAESPQELFEVLNDFLHEAKTLGIKEILTRQINASINLIDSLDGCCDDEECDC